MVATTAGITSDRSTVLSLISASAVVTLTATAYFLKRKRDEMQKKADQAPIEGFPTAPGAHWIFGHMGQLNANGFKEGYKTVFQDYADENGVCSFWFLNRPTMSVLLGKDAKFVLTSSSYREPLKALERHNENFLGPKALTSLMGKEWRLYRNAVHKSFTPGAIQQSQHVINQVATTLTDALLAAAEKEPKSQTTMKVLPLMKMATMDVFGLAALGYDFGCSAALKLTDIAAAFEFLASELTRRVQTLLNPTSLFYSIPTAANRKHRHQRKLIRAFISEQIAEAKARHERGDDAGSSTKQDLLANMIRTASKDEEFSDDALGDILMTLLFGGYDTTSITMSYALYLLARHPEIEAKCLEEIEAVFSNGEDSFTGPDQLPYTKAVILETLRLFPPAPLTTRNLEKPLTMYGKQLEKGTPVFVPIWSIQRDERNFPEPGEIIPERWVRPTHESNSNTSSWEERPGDDLKSHSIAPANRDAFVVFAAGARNCVGRILAMQESVTLLAFMIRRLKSDEVTEDRYEVTPRLASFIQQPDDGLPMVIKRR
eukprot:CAMPEP_0176015888 /NCGR_PEP_ID=MMETSP0120_2-20121206/7568_1 /TAXON_ID=160619 /ORGANISM="Kryptoperidinium foliaceum, Strain CCMP 1326" /LENGTH=543 /DNA_ID=CAMNT_0017348869 /DNA_START=200 /DNA_END=1831 /DNA_ORIENTATION=+